MATYPTSPRSAFLNWCAAHEPVFTANAAAIGLTPGQATEFADQTTAAIAADVAQEAAKQAAKVATNEVNGAVGALQTTTGNIVRSIRAFAELQADPDSIYNTAQIPPPATPTPAPPPAQPTELTVTLDSNSGDLMLAWKAANPAGTSGTAYLIRRKLPSESAFSFLGATGVKKFVDTTFVAGPDSVQYTVQGIRGDQTGPISPVFVVTFGQTPGGGMTAKVTETLNALTSDQAVVDAIVNSKPFASSRNGTTRSRV